MEEDAQSEASEWELWERREREEERRVEATELGARGEEQPLFPHAILHGVRRRGVGLGGGFRSFVFFLFVISLVRLLSSWDRPGRRAKGS